jgi:hypothetical protein
MILTLWQIIKSSNRSHSLASIVGAAILVAFPPGSDIAYMAYLGWGFSLWGMYNLSLSKCSLSKLLALSLLVNIIYFFYPFSDDVYRYLWEGYIQSHGYDPYIYDPNHTYLIEFRDTWWSGINHKDLSAAYPPLVQYLFQFLSLFYPSPNLWKAFLIFINIINALLLIKILNKENIFAQRFVLFLLNPFPLVFLIGEAHLDHLMIPFLLWAYYAYQKNKSIQLWIALGFAISIKYFPVLFILFFLKSKNWRFFPFVLLPLLSFAPYWDSPFFRSILQFASDFSFNSITNFLFAPANNLQYLFVFLVAAITLVYSYILEPLLAKNLALASFILIFLLPTVHPWYFALVLPWLCFHSFPAAWLWMSLSWACLFPMYHKAKLTGIWQENSWSLWAIWLPSLFCIGYEFWKGKRTLSFPPPKQVVKKMSILIPIFNEEKILLNFHESIKNNSNLNSEILYIDGGSDDNTLNLAKLHGLDIITSSKKGRGYQISEGIKQAQGDLILILHVDMEIPPNTFDNIWFYMQKSPNIRGGSCEMKFSDQNQLSLIKNLNHLRTRVLQIPFGDQLQFFRKDTFPKIDMPLMEDVEISMNLKEKGGITTLPLFLKVSSRRWDKIGRCKNTYLILKVCFIYLFLRKWGQQPKDPLFYYGQYYRSSKK